LPSPRSTIRCTTDEQQRARDVGVDDVLPLVRALLEEAVAESVARVRDQHVDRTVADDRKELIDAMPGGEVRLNFVDRDAKILERRSGLDEGRVGCDNQVVAVLRGELGNLKPDAARCAGDDGKLTRVHAAAPSAPEPAWPSRS
jgi:hypothetical protein